MSGGRFASSAGGSAGVEFGAITAVRKRLFAPRACIRLHNHFLAETFEAKSGRKVSRAEAENVVLNAGLRTCGRKGSLGLGEFGAEWQRGQNVMGRCYVGSGSSAPAATDTGLETPLAYASIARSDQIENATSYKADATNEVWYLRKRYVYNETVANYSLSEVGLAIEDVDDRVFRYSRGASEDTSRSPSEMFSRALFRDANGNPISITKTGSQIMVITATVYLQRGAVDSGMALLDNYLSKCVYELPDTLSGRDEEAFDEGGWGLGDGTAAPARDSHVLSGRRLASKEGGSDIGLRNALRWSGAGWDRSPHNEWPASEQQKTTFAVDWNLGEGNVTYSEILVTLNNRGEFRPDGRPGDSAVHIVLPCGTVSGSTSTKDNTIKRRMYFELAWG